MELRQKSIVKGKWYIWYGHGDFCAVLVRSPICAVLARSMTAPIVDHDVPYPNTAHKFIFGAVLGGMISLIATSTQCIALFVTADAINRDRGEWWKRGEFHL